MGGIGDGITRSIVGRHRWIEITVWRSKTSMEFVITRPAGGPEAIVSVDGARMVRAITAAR